MSQIIKGQTYLVNSPKYFADPPPIITIEGTDYDVFARSWMEVEGTVAMQYAGRLGVCGLPMDGTVYYGKIGHEGYFVHESELKPVREAVGR